jgi:putative chitinase
MQILVTPDQILKLAPKAAPNYRDAFAAGQSVLDHFQISLTPLRVAHFVAQMMHESGALTVLVENLNYSPERLPQVWPNRFQPNGPLKAVDFAHNPERLGNEVYGGRMGNAAPGDGFKYRGRGLLQLTGKDSYNEATQILRRSFPEAPDFVLQPDAATSAEWCLKVAAAKWSSKECNDKADRDSVVDVTKAINGGLIGIDQRTQWTERTKLLWVRLAGAALVGS